MRTTGRNYGLRMVELEERLDMPSARMTMSSNLEEEEEVDVENIDLSVPEDQH